MCIKEEIQFQKRKESEILAQNRLIGRLPVDRNTRTVDLRSTSGRPIQGRELQVWPVECVGRLPVDRYKAVSSRFSTGRLVGEPVDRLLKTVHVCAHRSTAPLGPVDRSSEKCCC